MGADTMTSRERVIRALCHQTPDRVPMNYHADGNFSKTLKAHFGLQGNQANNCWLTGNEDPRLLKALHCDLRMLVPNYVGPEIRTNPDGSFVSVFGEHLLIRENEIGAAFFEYPYLPLANAQSVQQVNAHPFPEVDWFDFSCIKDQLAEWDEYAIIAGDMGTLDCMNRCLTLFGYERVMIGMAEKDPIILTAFERIISFYSQYLERLMQAAGDRIDIVWLGEDLGTQKGPRISVSMYRELIRPLWEPILAKIHAHGCFVMQHSCGSTRAFYPDFIEMGIDVHDTVQIETEGMDPVEIKKQFGEHLCFHGGISIQRVLTEGTPDDVAREAKRLIDILGSEGGYILAPTHWIQSGTPIENVLTLYEVARDYSSRVYRD